MNPRFRFSLAALTVAAAAWLSSTSGFGDTHYVSPAGSNAPPYTSWTNAAIRIQDAVSVASSGDTILVADGTYGSGGAVTPGGILTNRIVATNAITIRSENGPTSTVVVGQGTFGTNGIRCAYLSGGAKLVGFTLSGGATATNGTFPQDQNAGGAYLLGGARSATASSWAIRAGKAAGCTSIPPAMPLTA